MSFNTSLSVQHSKQSQKPSICSENDINVLANTFEQKGNLLFSDQGKLVYQCGYYVLKEVYLPQIQQQPQQKDNHCVSDQQSQHPSSSASNQPVVSAVYPPSPIQSQQNEIDLKLILEKRIKDCLLLQNEFVITQKISCQNANIAKPIDFKATPARCMLFSPYMSEKDAFTHLIQKNAGIFQKIDYFSLENRSNEQDELLHRVRGILFGAMKLAFEIGSALKYLHEELNIAHNDIKPDNFFAHLGQHPLIESSNVYDYSNKVTRDDDGVQYYLGDFAYSKECGFTSQKEAKKFFQQKVQSYFSPEIFALIECGQIDLQNFEKQYDVFAFGISLFQILFQMNPFQSNGCHLSDTSFNLLHTNPEKFWSQLWQPLSVYGQMTNIDLMKDLLTKMLERDPSKRPNISQILQHPWLADIKHYFLQLTH
ncbi:hypothetical protein ABPG72_017323 [Tetrahymena utriculariae]